MVKYLMRIELVERFGHIAGKKAGTGKIREGMPELSERLSTNDNFLF